MKHLGKSIKPPDQQLFQNVLGGKQGDRKVLQDAVETHTHTHIFKYVPACSFHCRKPYSS